MIFGRKGPWPKVNSIFGAFLLTLLKPLSIVGSFEQRSSVVSVLILWINITQVKALSMFMIIWTALCSSLPFNRVKKLFSCRNRGAKWRCPKPFPQVCCGAKFHPLPEMRLSKASVAVGLCMWVIIWDWSEDALCKIMFTLHRVW